MIRRVTPEPSFLQARKILGLRESVMVFTGKGWISRERDESEKDEIVEWAHFYLCTDRFVPRPTESELESFRTQIEIKRAAA